MKTLWTPWRMEHVQGKQPSQLDCIFEPPGTTSHDKKHLLLYRDHRVIILLNRFPYANGHLLVAPRKHVSHQTDLDFHDQAALMWAISQSTVCLENILHPDGFNIGLNIGKTAGAGIADHIHFHLVPRWENDHNFITVCADIRTIPQHIDHTFDLLLPAIQDNFRQTPYQDL